MEEKISYRSVAEWSQRQGHREESRVDTVLSHVRRRGQRGERGAWCSREGPQKRTE